MNIVVETFLQAASLALIWAGIAALIGVVDPLTVGIYSFGACALGFLFGKKGW